MKVLICYTRFPWPPNKGDTLTVLKLLQYLSERHEVHFLTVEPSDSSHLCHLPPKIRAITRVANPMPTRLLRLGRSLLAGRSLQVDSFFSKAYSDARKRLLREGHYDLLYSHYIRSFGHDDFDGYGARKVIGLQLSHQAHFSRAASNESNPMLRWLYCSETRRLEYWESKIASFNDLIHLVSRRDLMRIKHRESWQDRVLFNPHGVDQSEFFPEPRSRVCGRVVFTGNLGFQANEDAVLWFARDIWPCVLARSAAAEWLVAGARPTAAVRAAIATSPRARLTPFPPRMAEVIQSGDVAVDPLRIGAGLQNKVLEAMACGLPVVATRLANEGIGACDGREIVLADDANHFSRAISDLLVDRRRNASMGAAARALIERAWSWERHFGHMEDCWGKLTN